MQCPELSNYLLFFIAVGVIATACTVVLCLVAVLNWVSDIDDEEMRDEQVWGPERRKGRQGPPPRWM